MVRTLAELKRTLKVGDRLTMIRHDWFPEGKLLNVPRYIVATNTQGIVLNEDSKASDGSHLLWPKASRVQLNGNTFSIQLNPETQDRMTYTY